GVGEWRWAIFVVYHHAEPVGYMMGEVLLEMPAAEVLEVPTGGGVGGWLAVAQAPPAAGAVGLAAAAPDVLHVGVRGTRWVLTRGQVRDWLTHRASRPQMMLVHQRGDS